VVKPDKQFRKQADKADRVASRTPDPDVAADLRALATAYRGQADALKRKKKAKKKDR
jgi:hypothetical protein